MEAQNKSCCKFCKSENRSEFNSELAIHFRGRQALDKPVMWVFPSLLVCLDCGLTEFVVPDRELLVLRDGTPMEGAIISRPPISNRKTRLA